MKEYTVMTDWGDKETTETEYSLNRAKKIAAINVYFGGAVYAAVYDGRTVVFEVHGA